MDKEILEGILKPQFKDFFRVEYKRPDLLQLLLPIYHPDGDMMDIFIEEAGNKFAISDYGLTLMRLSYEYDIDTPNKEKILRKILAESCMENESGNLKLYTSIERLVPAILQFTQAIAKIGNMKLYKKEVIHSLFFEMLDDFIMGNLAKYNPKKKYIPIPGHDEYEVDYCINSRPRPIFLFGINNNNNARLATISCQKFISDKIPFRSFMILESLGCVGNKDLMRLMSAADKQFPDFSDFEKNAEAFIERYDS